MERKRQIEELFPGGRALQAGDVAKRLGVTRQTAHRYLRELVDEGSLISEGAGRSTRYRRSSYGHEKRYPTRGLEEDLVWSELSGPGSALEDLPEKARTLLQYSITELVNNVIDHSGAEQVLVSVDREPDVVRIDVCDEGVGIFEHIRQGLDLRTEIEALQELSKGKTTTMPDRHTGEGIFFVSKAVNLFEIRSGSLTWILDNRGGDMAVGEIDPPQTGTTVRVEVDVDDARDLTEVFEEYTEDFEFAKTRTVVKLFAFGTRFVSRSEAKRLVHGLEKFREVVLDFDGVELVGQGFVDEIFRVWALQHPEIRLVPVAMNDAVEFMVERAMRRANRDSTP
jgi:anti-sigma regulatory factor (Ser/Thr protein kinase)